MTYRTNTAQGLDVFGQRSSINSKQYRYACILNYAMGHENSGPNVDIHNTKVSRNFRSVYNY